MPNQELISVIIAALNVESFIATAVESVLNQDHVSLDVVVVDDGSTDRTADVVARFGSAVRCVRQPHAGLPAAHNRGLSEAKGEFITFLDADDLYEPGCLLLQLDKLKSNPTVEFVMGRKITEEICSAPDEPPVYAPLESPTDICMSLAASLFRRSAFETVGKFDESLSYCHDWDWFMRARELDVPMLLHREHVLRKRVHMHNMTRDVMKNQYYMAVMLKRSIDRRRRASGEARSLASFSVSLEPLPSISDLAL